MAARLCRYQRRVLIAPPLPEIFRQDSERKQGFKEAVRTHDAMVATYTGYGYELVELPRLPVEARLRFVLDAVA
jgi:predicted ATPase